MKAVVTVTGKDSVGIIAAVSSECAKFGGNIVDISQTVMDHFFTMIMLVDTSASDTSMDEIRQALQEKEAEMGVSIRIQQEDIFQAMHRI